MEIGDVVEHKLNREWLLVIDISDDTFLCRTKKFELISFFNFELQPRGG